MTAEQASEFVDTYFKKFDANEDGELDYGEFVKGFSSSDEFGTAVSSSTMEDKFKEAAAQEFPTLGIQLTYLKELKSQIESWAETQPERPAWCAPQFVDAFAERRRAAKGEGRSKNYQFQVNTAEAMVGFFRPNSDGKSWCQV